MNEKEKPKLKTRNEDDHELSTFAGFLALFIRKDIKTEVAS